jgi:(E)-2-((N-methylformamido)methylene)succinate hydrolase
MAERLTMPARIHGGAAGATSYIRSGAGEPLLLIHGVGMNATIWQPQIELLKSRYDVISIDMLGHGESRLPPESPVLSDYANRWRLRNWRNGRGSRRVSSTSSPVTLWQSARC